MTILKSSDDDGVLHLHYWGSGFCPSSGFRAENLGSVLYEKVGVTCAIAFYILMYVYKKVDISKFFYEESYCIFQADNLPLVPYAVCACVHCSINRFIRFFSYIHPVFKVFMSYTGVVCREAQLKNQGAGN